jgi:hypothetical protein
MDEKTSKALDDIWFEQDEVFPNTWVKVVSCGPILSVRVWRHPVVSDDELGMFANFCDN